MKKLIYSLRQATRNRFTNYLKIASLALGIAIGGLAIARYTFHSSFEKNLENFDQINFLTMDWTINNDQTYSQSTYTMEPMGRTMVEQIPSVESAVAFFDNFTYTYELGEKQFDLNTLELCNETFFDVFPYPILSGDPHQIFDDQALIMVSQSTANKLSENGDVMDLTIKIKDHLYTIKGVYEDFPSNSRFYGTEVMVHKKYDWGGWQSDAFQTFFTLNREISQEELDAQIKQAFAPHLENHKSAGIQVECHSFHIKEYAKVTEGSNLGNNIYLILGVLLIIISSFNFALMQINSLSTRAIEVAIHKVNGAKRRDLFMLVMWETLYYIIMAVLLAILVARVLKTPAEAVLGRYEEILNLRGLWSIGAALLLITLIAGVLPALIFIRIPALHIFSKSRLNNLWWKNGLLYIQMFVTIIVGTMTIVIIMQFRMMTTLDLGYSTDNLHITSLRDVSAEKGHLLKEKLLSTSGVVGACYTDQNIVEQLSGRTLMNQGQSEVALSCRELAADEDFFWTYQVPLIEGDSTTLHSDGRKSYMVCQEVLRKTVSTIGEYNFYSNGLEGVFGSIRGNLYLPVQPLILYPIREDCTTRILTLATSAEIA
ncbi:MAG: ABC transporter permease, partial [Rikenellaceae bacterium]